MDTPTDGAITRHPDSPFRVADWQADVTQMLDEHHLTWSAQPRKKLQFAASLQQFLGGLRDAEVCTLYGRSITDLESFCQQLERACPGPELARKIDGPGGVASLLRHRETFSGRPASKFRYYVWHDSEVLLHHDPRLFGRLAETIAGIAAEAEYASDDLLLITGRSSWVARPWTCMPRTKAASSRAGRATSIPNRSGRSRPG